LGAQTPQQKLQQQPHTQKQPKQQPVRRKQQHTQHCIRLLLIISCGVRKKSRMMEYLLHTKKYAQPSIIYQA
jgi:hypothetical protein